MKTIKTIAFYLAILILLVAGMCINVTAGNKAANRKAHRIYAKRAESCRSEQLRIQSSGQKHYSKRNYWQPRSTRHHNHITKL
jgi:hypothetical protein